MRRGEPEPGFLHVIAHSDQSKGLGRARILLAKARRSDSQSDLGVTRRQTLCVFVKAKRRGRVATLQCGGGTITGILHSGTAIAAHLVGLPLNVDAIASAG
jgi:hypothetical protein